MEPFDILPLVPVPSKYLIHGIDTLTKTHGKEKTVIHKKQRNHQKSSLSRLLYIKDVEETRSIKDLIEPGQEYLIWHNLITKIVRIFPCLYD
jgi:hypothetical protein